MVSAIGPAWNVLPMYEIPKRSVVYRRRVYDMPW